METEITIHAIRDKYLDHNEQAEIAVGQNRDLVMRYIRCLENELVLKSNQLNNFKNIYSNIEKEK